MLSQWLMSASLLVSGAAALLIQPTNTTTNSSDVVELIVGSIDFGALQPLTQSATVNLNMGIHDTIYHVTTQNRDSLTGQEIAYISCDSGDYTGFLSLNDVYRTALGVNASAIILYSLISEQCNLTDPETAYQRVFSMSNHTISQEVLNAINNISVASASIQYTSNSNRNNVGSQQNPTSTYGSSPTTAVAMIILYSVTGIITALFLIIIITGAIRAHRHPERYGPRNVLGRPRQTRARGIARAMLDTIPVVKFGEQAKPDPKVADIELADTDTPVIRRSVENDGTQETDTRDHAEPRLSMASARSGIGAATGHADSDAIAGVAAAESSEALGCSICTDDFEMGQDLRVLPCDHKFHPACIDPWLLNVSSTCPLCRIDLRSEGSTDADAPADEAGENGDLPPPINGYNGQPYRVSMRRSLLIGLGLDRGHLDQGQRMAAARELRELDHENVNGVEAAQQDQGEEGRQRRRLRERFGVRTRRRGQSDAQAQAVATVPEETATAGPTANSEADSAADQRPTTT
ncbi:hypothetical protein QM012_002375 [Aureobasidium pullulans]|uniref:RING-type E3 ubiquitin transferase n=1 Tax=Aureobasidium pullulans TaxID=5580 RepID=A0ABR0TD32_AURPU